MTNTQSAFLKNDLLTGLQNLIFVVYKSWYVLVYVLLHYTYLVISFFFKEYEGYASSTLYLTLHITKQNISYFMNIRIRSQILLCSPIWQNFSKWNGSYQPTPKILELALTSFFNFFLLSHSVLISFIIAKAFESISYIEL